MDNIKVGDTVVVSDLLLVGDLSGTAIGAIGVVTKLLDTETFNVVVHIGLREYVFDKLELTVFDNEVVSHE